MAPIVWGFNQIHTRFQTAIICIGFGAPDCISWTIIIAPWPLFELSDDNDYLNILMIMMNLDVVTRDQAIKRARFCRENYSDTRLCQHLEPSPLSVVMVVILLMMTMVVMIMSW